MNSELRHRLCEARWLKIEAILLIQLYAQTTHATKRFQAHSILVEERCKTTNFLLVWYNVKIVFVAESCFQATDKAYKLSNNVC
jgi:hypothetical protein